MFLTRGGVNFVLTYFGKNMFLTRGLKLKRGGKLIGVISHIYLVQIDLRVDGSWVDISDN